MTKIKMTNRRIKKGIILGAVALLLILVTLFIANFNLFEDDKPIEIIQFDSGDSKYKIAVSYVPSNATIQEQITIQKVYSSGNRKLLSTFERYQVLMSYQIVADSLVLVLADTSSYVQRTDTLKIKIAEDNN